MARPAHITCIRHPNKKDVSICGKKLRLYTFRFVDEEHARGYVHPTLLDPRYKQYRPLVACPICLGDKTMVVNKHIDPFERPEEELCCPEGVIGHPCAHHKESKDLDCNGPCEQPDIDPPENHTYLPLTLKEKEVLKSGTKGPPLTREQANQIEQTTKEMLLQEEEDEKVQEVFEKKVKESVKRQFLIEQHFDEVIHVPSKVKEGKKLAGLPFTLDNPTEPVDFKRIHFPTEKYFGPSLPDKEELKLVDKANEYLRECMLRIRNHTRGYDEGNTTLELCSRLKSIQDILDE